MIEDIAIEKPLPEFTSVFFEESLDELEMEIDRRLATKRSEFLKMAKKLNFRL